MMFLDWQFTAQERRISRTGLVINTARRFILIDAMYRDVPVMCGVHTFMSTMTPRLACGLERGGFQKKMGSIFQDSLLCGLRPRPPRRLRLAGPIWCKPLPRMAKRLAEACRPPLRKAGSKTELSLLKPPHSLCCDIFRDWAAGYQDKPAVNELAMSITDNLTVGRRMDREGRAQFSGNERRRNSTCSRRAGSSRGSVTRSLTQ